VGLLKLASLMGQRLPLILLPVDFAAYTPLMAQLSSMTDVDLDALTGRLAEAAMRQSPLLQAAQLDQKKALATVELGKTTSMPTVNASWSHGLNFKFNQAVTPGTGSVGITATIPLDYWNQGPVVDLAALSARQSLLDYDETVRQLQLDIQSDLYDMISAASTVFSSEKALEYAVGNYQGVLEMFRLGSASSTTLSDARTLVSTNRYQWISARFQFLEKLSTLQTLIGAETEASLLLILRG